MQLDREIILTDTLTESIKREMFHLMDCNYANSDLNLFEKDLSEKNWVIMLYEKKNHKLVGFSTQKLFEIRWNDTPCLILFSGDTIISKEYWGSLGLSISFGELMLTILNQFPEIPLYWMLISKGLRTYKFLPTFFINYYPAHEKKTPIDIRELMNFIGNLKFQDRYNTQTGIIEAEKNGQYLNVDLEPNNKTLKPHEQFFYDLNPGYSKGDELLCLAQLSMDNITPFIKRVLAKLS